MTQQVTDAEVSVLGSMLIHPNAIDGVATVLTARDFTTPAHAAIFTALLALREGRVDVDLVTLSAELARKGKLEKVGGDQYLMEITDAVPAAANVASYAEIVREASALRRIGQIGERLASAAKSPASDAADLAAKAVDTLDAIIAPTAAESVVTARDAAKAFSATVDEAQDRGKPSLIPTGIGEIDAVLTGIGRGRLVVIGGETHAGKSALASNIAVNVAESGHPVIYASLEMGAAELAGLMACMCGAPSTGRLVSGRLTEAELREYSAALARVAALPITFVDKPSLSAAELGALARVASRDARPALIVADYVQIMAGPKADRRDLEIAGITRGLKGLSRELNCCVLALSQLNNRHGDGRPSLRDSLREGAAQGQDADVVAFITRPCRELSADQMRDRQSSGLPTRDNHAICMIVKNRVTGQTGDAVMAWNPVRIRFGGTPPPEVSEALRRG